MEPLTYQVVGRRVESGDVVTLALEPVAGEIRSYRPGQFNMLSAFGVGEVAISISSAPREGRALRHTVRDVGAVSHALCASAVGDLVGVRGPFGTDWSLDETDARTQDSVIVAGGVGLAPLRGAASELVARLAEGGGRVFILVGARDPSQLIFDEDLTSWSDAGAHVEVTVDRGSPDWSGRVGLVTTLLASAGFEPARTRAMVCGPEIMMRFTARALEDMGVDPRRILVSLERNMQCGLGWCGHCQLGSLLLCRDGPVVAYDGEVRQVLTERER
jgi:NAD(P)H-flavin reductase